MKKGCFITTIVVFTILVGAGLYIFQNHFDDFVLNPGKKLIAGFIENEFETKLVNVVDSPEKRELKRHIRDYSNNVEKYKNITEEDINKVISSIDSAILDSIINKSELEEIKQLSKRLLK